MQEIITPEEFDELLEVNVDLLIDNAMKNTVINKDGKHIPSKEWFEENNNIVRGEK